MLRRPEADEYAPEHVGYLSRVPEGDVLEIMSDQLKKYSEAIGKAGDEEAARPGERGWSIKQIMGHVCDGERILGYRALRFARGDSSELPGFEQDDYVRESAADNRSLKDLLAEFEHLREANLAMFRSLPEEAAARTGVANGKQVSVRALAYIIAGHAQHHLAQLHERFGL